MLKFEPQMRDVKFFYSINWAPERREYITFDDLAAMVGPGWKDLLEDLCVKLLELGWDGGFQQVKEKFGGLRFYWHNDIKNPTLAEVAEDVVDVAERDSEETCERCGKLGRLRSKGFWLYTACDEHTDAGSSTVMEDS